MIAPKPHLLIQLGVPSRISRRAAMQWLMAAAAASALPTDSFAAPTASTSAPQAGAAPSTQPSSAGYGPDPNLVAIHKPGDIWPLTFTAEQRTTVKSLADLILPKDQFGPAASEVGVLEMLDEWISAPYPQQKADRPVILDGLAWLNAESGRRFSKPFAELPEGQQRVICDEICFTHTAKPDLRKAAGFFSRFRSLCAAAYYATPAGWKAIGYVGNVALPSFDGPPAEVLEKLGVTQTVR